MWSVGGKTPRFRHKTQSRAGSMDDHRLRVAWRLPRKLAIRSMRGRIRVLFAGLLLLAGAVDAWISLAPAGQAYGAGQMVVILIPALAAAWVWVELDMLRPLSSLTAAGSACAQGQEGALPRETRNLATEFASLRRSIGAMANALSGQRQRVDDALVVERALLREVNHRIRNNLQMVASILSLETPTDEGQEVLGAARARDRIRLLSLAHDRIYSSGDVYEVRLDDLAAEIGRTFMLTRGASVRNVRLEMALAPALTTNDCAVPMAFLVGESLSYALDVLRTDTAATLTMGLRTETDGVIAFSLSSPEFPEPRTPPSNVRRIIDAFASQLSAEVEVLPSGPILVRIRLPSDGLRAAA